MYRKALTTVLAGLTLTLLLAVSAMAAEVIQGKCVEYDQKVKTITVEEYDINFDAENPYGHATNIQSTVDVATAKLGIEPEAGDILRIAYNVEGDRKVALKVMNVSKQDLRKK